MTGFIYAIHCQGMIKLGYSTRPKLRFFKIQSDSPFECKMLGFWEGTETDERALHETYNHLHVRGEWFHSSQSLLEFIILRTLDMDVENPKFVLFSGQRVPRGTKVKLAAALGITPGAISQWPRVPSERVLEVERVTGISRHELRPDLYPQEQVA